MKQWSWEDQELVRLQQVECEYKALKQKVELALTGCPRYDEVETVISPYGATTVGMESAPEGMWLLWCDLHGFLG